MDDKAYILLGCYFTKGEITSSELNQDVRKELGFSNQEISIAFSTLKKYSCIDQVLYNDPTTKVKWVINEKGKEKYLLEKAKEDSDKDKEKRDDDIKTLTKTKLTTDTKWYKEYVYIISFVIVVIGFLSTYIALKPPSANNLPNHNTSTSPTDNSRNDSTNSEKRIHK